MTVFSTEPRPPRQIDLLYLWRRLATTLSEGTTLSDLKSSEAEIGISRQACDTFLAQVTGFQQRYQGLLPLFEEGPARQVLVEDGEVLGKGLLDFVEAQSMANKSLLGEPAALEKAKTIAVRMFTQIEVSAGRAANALLLSGAEARDVELKELTDLIAMADKHFSNRRPWLRAKEILTSRTAQIEGELALAEANAISQFVTRIKIPLPTRGDLFGLLIVIGFGALLSWQAWTARPERFLPEAIS